MAEDEKIKLQKFKGFIQMSHELDRMIADSWSGWMNRWLLSEQRGRMFGPEGVRKHHVEVEPVTEERRAAFAEFEKRWSAVVAEGEETGFLGYEEGYYLSEPHDTRKVIYDETDEEWDARVAKLEPLFGARQVGGDDDEALPEL